MSSNGIVNKRYEDICQEHKKKATLGYNNSPGWFKIDQGAVSTYNMEPMDIPLGYSTRSSYYEILLHYFKNYNVEPNWINGNGVWGHIDTETGKWNGLIALVRTVYPYPDYKL